MILPAPHDRVGEEPGPASLRSIGSLHEVDRRRRRPLGPRPSPPRPDGHISRTGTGHADRADGALAGAASHAVRSAELRAVRLAEP